jgi:hypothetical protein
MRFGVGTVLSIGMAFAASSVFGQQQGAASIQARSRARRSQNPLVGITNDGSPTL